MTKTILDLVNEELNLDARFVSINNALILSSMRLGVVSGGAKVTKLPEIVEWAFDLKDDQAIDTTKLEMMWIVLHPMIQVNFKQCLENVFHEIAVQWLLSNDNEGTEHMADSDEVVDD